jgi:hypothetical protein
MTPDNLEPTEAELRDCTDEALHASGKPLLKRTPEEGITDMHSRIADLTEQKRKLLDQMETRDDCDIHLANINADLIDCQQRLTAYELQKSGKN